MSSVINFDKKDFNEVYDNIKKEMHINDKFGIYCLDFQLDSFVHQVRNALTDDGYHVKIIYKNGRASFTVSWGHMHSRTPAIEKVMGDQNAKIQARVDIADHIYELIDNAIDIDGKVTHNSRQVYFAELVRVLSMLDLP